MQITSRDLDRKLKSGFVDGIYLFYGDEPYLKDYYLRKFREAVCPDPDFAAFNHIKIEDGDLARLFSELDGSPLFGGARLIEFRGADFGKMQTEKGEKTEKSEKSGRSGKGEKSEKADKTDKLKYFCENLKAADGLCVIIDAAPSELPEGTAKKPSAVLNALTAVTEAVKFERQTPAKLALWAERHFAANGVKADDEVCRCIVDFCSPDMYILSGEIEKLSAYTKSQNIEKITKETVGEVASPNRVFGAFDFSNAIIAGDKKTALAALAGMKLRKEPPERILATISKITSELLAVRTLSDKGVARQDIGKILGIADYPLGLRMNAASKSTPEALKAAADAVGEADKKMKTTSLSGYLLIEQLILLGR
jgi:DNA polymerase III subunit delta